MNVLLDQPVWSALATRHADLAKGDSLARRYPSEITALAGIREDSAECRAALARLPGTDEALVVLQAEPVRLPDELATVTTAEAVQMVARDPLPRIEDPRIVLLQDADAPEMLALATLTRPGPFSLGAARLGQFWGVRTDGRLVAMAGERMKQPGFAELSGVCSHPDARGQGYARLLSRFVAARISARRERPYLHAYATNAAAIGLYESIGFAIRRAMAVTVFKRRD